MRELKFLINGGLKNSRRLVFTEQRFIDYKTCILRLLSFHLMISKEKISPPRLLFSTNDAALPSSPYKAKTGVVPFSFGRFDVSVSEIGGPNDRRQSKIEAKKEMTMLQIQNFKAAITTYRKQILLMSNASNAMVKVLQDLADCVPQARIRDVKMVGKLDFFIDSSQLMSNAHQTWGDTLRCEVEHPINLLLDEISSLSNGQRLANRQKIDFLMHKLHSEEVQSLKMKRNRVVDAVEVQKVSYMFIF